MSHAPSSPPAANIFIALWRRKVLIALGTLLGLFVGFGLAMLEPSTYVAESRVFLSSQAPFDAISQNPSTGDPARYVDQQASLLTSSPVLTRSLALGARAADLDELRTSLDVVASAESDVLTVTASGSTAEDAASRVNSTIAAYREYQKGQVTAQLAAISTLSKADERRLASQRAAVYGDGVALVEEATVDEASPVIRNTTILALVGALISAAIAVALSKRPSHAPARASTPTPTPQSQPTAPASDQTGAPDWTPVGQTSDAPSTGKARRPSWMV